MSPGGMHGWRSRRTPSGTTERLPEITGASLASALDERGAEDLFCMQ